MVHYPLISWTTYSDMKSLIFLCFVAVALAENEACGEHETYNECGTACPLNCDNYQNPPKFCKLLCVSGCHCNEGYVRSHDGTCVLPQNCPSTADLCALPPEVGRCRGYFPRYHFDPVTGQCKKFIYGGCAGNKNRFKTEAECLQSCKVSAIRRALDRPDCDKGAEIGSCRGRFPRFYYDQEAGMCKSFIYGGCGGNRNNFETEFDCYNKCGALYSVSVCDEEKVAGPCKGAFHRYFYNKETGECEEFIYGGCRGNSNNFISKDECHATCA